MTINEVMERLWSYYPPSGQGDRNDTLKYGDGEQECTGVGITCFASSNVIREAKARGLNLIICHEAVFWNNDDKTSQYADNPIFQAKKSLLDETGVTIWRNHDHIHGGAPMREGKPNMDGIFQGVMEELGWKLYLQRWDNMPLMYKIPQTTASKLAEELMEKFNLTGIRVVGDPNTPTSAVYFCEHVQGRRMGPRDDKYVEDDELIQMTIDYDVDVLVPLEIIDWTATSFIRDSAQLGRPRAILEMGHFNFEELGMRYITRYLPDLVEHSFPVEYIQSGDVFSYMIRKQPAAQ
ncbi:MAG: Nif3-like dinuclear metal center hexameric protein [Clostridiales bacterium]|nr:Nif3-like dinuclear metal center hexameric protein [Clostridiales bacterium]